MFILWEPEEGRCFECGNDPDEVRGFSDGKTFGLYCFFCWTESQEEEIVSFDNWSEPVVIVYNFEEEPHHNHYHGNPQRFATN